MVAQPRWNYRLSKLQALQERVRYYRSILTARAGMQEGRKKAQQPRGRKRGFSRMCKRADDCLRVCGGAAVQQRTCEKGIGSDRGFILTKMTIDETHGLACRDTAA